MAAGIRAWVGQRSFELSNRGAVVELFKGINDITLAIDRNVREQGSLKIQLRDAEHSPAQIRLVMEQ